MKIYAIGDLHLAIGCNKPMDIFGEVWDNHIEKIKEAWQQKITAEDYVIICGDISWGMSLKEANPDLDFLEALPGYKICIRGNHDFWWEKITKLNNLYKSIHFLQNTSYTIGDISICGTRGWSDPETENFTDKDQKIYERELIRLKLSLDQARGTEKIVALHYPPTVGKQSSKLTKLLEDYHVQTVVYGHIHDVGGWEDALKGIYHQIQYHLVAADYIGFDPICIR